MWPDAPVGPIDPDYAESLALTERTFDDVAGGKGMNVVTVRDIVQLLIRKVAGQQRRARADSVGQAVREPDLLPFGQRRDAQPADRQAARVRRGGDRCARGSGAPARHRQDAHSRSTS